MGIKPTIFLLLLVQNCLSYPIDDQDSTNGAESSQQFSNDFSTTNTNAQTMENFNPESVPINSHREIRQYLSEMEPNTIQFGSDYPNIAESNRPNHFGGHRPIGRPPRPHPQPPMDIPDDVEVFSPPGPSRPISPPRPIPTGPMSPPDVETFWPINGKPVQFPKGEVFPSPGSSGLIPVGPVSPPDVETFWPINGKPVQFPKGEVFPSPGYPGSIPVGPVSPPDVETFWPINGKPVPFPKGEVFGPAGDPEMLPNQQIVFERKHFQLIPENIEGNIRMMPEPMRNERPVTMESDGSLMTPVLFEKQGSVILEREQPQQMMSVYVENNPARMPPTIIERIERPVMIQDEQLRMTPFRENERAPMTMEKEMPFMRPEEQPKMTFRSPSEFRPIPQVLPERFKRENQILNENFETLSSSQEKESDRAEKKSVVDNEIEISNDAMQEIDDIIKKTLSTIDMHADDSSTKKLPTLNGSSAHSEISVESETSSTVANITPTTISTVIDTSRPDSDSKIENEKPATVQNTPSILSQPVSKEPIEEVSTTISTEDSKKILNTGDSSSTSKIFVDEESKSEQPSHLEISTTIQPPNNKTDEKISTTLSAPHSTKILYDDDSSFSGKILIDEYSKYEHSSSSDISTTPESLITSNDEKIIKSTSTSTLDSKVEMATGQQSSSDISTTDQAPNKKDEKIIASTITNISDAKNKDLNRNLTPGQPLHPAISATEQPLIENKKITEKKDTLRPSTTTTSIADAKIETGSVNKEQAAPEGGIHSTKPAEISTVSQISAAEEIEAQLKEQLLTEVKKLLDEIIESNRKGQNKTLNKHPIPLQNINEPSIYFDAAEKPPSVYPYYAPIGGFSSPFYTPNENRGPILFPQSSQYQVGLPDLQYKLNKDLGQLLGGVLDVEHELQSLPVSHGVHCLSPIAYPSYEYNNLQYPLPQFSQFSIGLRRVSTDHLHKHN